MASDCLTFLSFVIMIAGKVLDGSRYYVGPCKKQLSCGKCRSFLFPGRAGAAFEW